MTDKTVTESPPGNLRHLTETVANELNVPTRTASRVVSAVLAGITIELSLRKRVALKGFGTLERRIRGGRSYTHPKTKAKLIVPDRETIVFRPSARLIEDTCDDPKGERPAQ